MSVTMGTVEQYLKQYGWTYEKPQEQLVVTGFRGKADTFRVFVQVADPWVLLAIAPFVPQPAPECRDRFCRFLLRLNYEINLAKIGVDPDGDISLSIELRAEDLRFEDFAIALDALSAYADEYYLTLTNMACDPDYKPRQDYDVWSEAIHEQPK